MKKRDTKPIHIAGLAHIGIRVHDLGRSVAFYELLGFTKTAGPIGPEPVAILDHPSGVEINLVLNAPKAHEPNILMDVPEKHPGITHIALWCDDLMAAKGWLPELSTIDTSSYSIVPKKKGKGKSGGAPAVHIHHKFVVIDAETQAPLHRIEKMKRKPPNQARRRRAR